MADVEWRGMSMLPQLWRNIDRLFEEFFRTTAVGVPSTGTFVPSLEVEETEDAYLLRVELPGVDPNQMELDITGDVLNLRGEKRQDEEGKYYCCERRYGRFARSVRLPPGVDTSNITAEYRNGVLEVKIPKTEEAKARKIPVQVETKAETVTASATA